MSDLQSQIETIILAAPCHFRIRNESAAAYCDRLGDGDEKPVSQWRHPECAAAAVAAALRELPKAHPSDTATYVVGGGPERGD